MKPIASIELFLRQLKNFVEKNSFVLVDRKASMQLMADRGMLLDTLRDVILSVRPEDCFDGPEADRDPRFADKWTVAEFAPTYHNETLYLKLSIRVDVGRVKCLSVKAYTRRGAAND